MLGGLTVILMLAMFAHAGIAFAEAEIAWLASYFHVWPWLTSLQHGLGRITRPAKELVAHVWPDVADNDVILATAVGGGSLVLALLLSIATLRAFA